MTTSIPANASSPANISPVGPPPAITTARSVIAYESWSASDRSFPPDFAQTAVMHGLDVNEPMRQEVPPGSRATTDGRRRKLWGRGDPAPDGTPLVSADDVRKRSRRKVFIEALDVETQFGRVPFVRLLT